MEIENPCVYCGLTANTIDHIPPIVARTRIIKMGLRGRYKFIIVNACYECNLALGGLTLWTITERKKFIKKYIKKKYAKYLRIPDWPSTEIEELGKDLSEDLKNSLVIRDATIARLKW